jgi:hypothetical protein
MRDGQVNAVPLGEAAGVPVAQQPTALRIPAAARRVPERREVPGRLQAAGEPAVPAAGGEFLQLPGLYGFQSSPRPSGLAALEELGEQVTGKKGSHWDTSGGRTAAKSMP